MHTDVVHHRQSTHGGAGWSRRLLCHACVVAAALVVSPAAVAQVVGGNVGGVVTDETGGALPGVSVTLTNKANGRVITQTTGEEGNYRAVALQPAPYDIVAELAGFQTVRREVTVTVGADLTIDIRMGVASLEETVTVMSEAPLVEVTKSQPSSVVVGDQVASLPVLERNFLGLAQLLPGSGPDNSRTQYFNPTKFGGVADQRNGFTTVIDGGDVDDAIWGSTTMNYTQEAVQEFKVYRNQFDAQYGSALSAVVTVASKSGTNNFRGSGFYFGRDAALNARNAFTRTKPPFDQQRVGGSLGGPVLLNRTHFFGAYEYSNVDTVKVIALPAVNPFATEENGVFPSGNQNHMVSAKLDHRFNDAHALFVRYAYDDQDLLRTRNASSDSNQIDEYSQSHSLVAEESWVLSSNHVNTLRVHFLKQDVGNVPHSYDLSISRPSVTTGQSGISPQFFPRTKVVAYDTLYINTPRHDIKIGGEVAFANTEFEAHFNEHGQFSFATDAPFDPNDSRTWPFAFVIQNPGFYEYASKQLAFYVQDDWRVGERLRLNLGLRYDYDTNLRNNEFYADVIDNPRFAGIENFISKDRGNDWDNFQPRVGATWDVRGNGTLVMRGGVGMYVTRNRPWFQLTSMDRTLGGAVRIEDPQRLRSFPDINAVLGGQSLDSFLASGGAKSLFLISDEYVLPYAVNTSVGMGWQLGAQTSLDVDYVHDYNGDALGGTDRNLPPAGPISASNPRPVREFTQVNVMENFTDAWYDALEVQLRTRPRGTDNMLVSYTLSRSYRDGVDFYSTFRGTQRTPDERGYNNTDQRHNLTMAASGTLPFLIQLSGIVKLVSGSPIPVQAGFDLDGDGSVTGDRPPGLPRTVGREQVDESLRAINDLRASRGLSPIDPELLNLDPYVSVDLRVTKAIPLGGNRRLDILFEGYNLTNHVNYQPFTVNGNIISSSFLIRDSARDARQFQWGVRYAF